jgi:Uma2 family endonuclease
MRVGAILTRVFSNCTVFSSDMRLRIGASDLTTYPDVSVVCGKVQRAADDPLAITNPGVIVEVTSPSTKEYDRGEKLDRYRSIPSLQAVLILSHRGPTITYGLGAVAAAGVPPRLERASG